MKRRIGISRTEPQRSHQRYLDWFQGEDVELVVLSPGNEPDVETCDGLILTGGVDVDPGLYGGDAEYDNMEVVDPARDAFEGRIYAYARERRLPILAICRGMQLVNVLEGGKLIQDLGPEGNAVHRKVDKEDKQHDLGVVAQSLLLESAGAAHGRVNSAHHQAVDPVALGHNLMPNARSGDCIEGLEFADKTGRGFMLCVQWHPERMSDKETSPFSARIKQRFLTEIRNHDGH